MARENLLTRCTLHRIEITVEAAERRTNQPYFYNCFMEIPRHNGGGFLFQRTTTMRPVRGVESSRSSPKDSMTSP